MHSGFKFCCFLRIQARTGGGVCSIFVVVRVAFIESPVPIAPSPPLWPSHASPPQRVGTARSTARGATHAHGPTARRYVPSALAPRSIGGAIGKATAFRNRGEGLNEVRAGFVLSLLNSQLPSEPSRAGSVAHGGLPHTSRDNFAITESMLARLSSTDNSPPGKRVQKG